MEACQFKQKINFTQKEWVKSQYKTSIHIFTVLLYSVICGLVAVYPNIAFWGPLVFFLITFFIKISDIFSYMIFSIVITAIASFINPILGIIVSGIFFLLKISNFINNWRGLLSGIFIYLLPAILSYFSNGIIYSSQYTLYDLNSPYVIIEFMPVFVFAIIGALTMNTLLIWLYKNKYSAKSAIATINNAPLVIFLLILPFIINAVVDLVDDLMIDNNFVDFSDVSDTIDLDGDGINDNVHEVRGHFRSTPDGDMTYVDSYIRTDPNSIISDNISYHR